VKPYVEPPLRLEGITKFYRRGLFGKADAEPTLDDVDLTVHRGEVVGLIGESGSGKTTLAQVALALAPIDSGTATVLGSNLHSLPHRTLQRFRRRAQLLFQNASAHLNPGLNVVQILGESARLHRPNTPVKEAVDEALAWVGLNHRRDAFPFQLSGGECRRVGLAKVMMARPELLIADEPTSGLDAGLKAELIDLILEQHTQQSSLLIISHDLPLVKYACSRVVVMLAGRVVERFATATMGQQTHHPYTNSLLAAAGMGQPSPEQQTGATTSLRNGCPFVEQCPAKTGPCTSVRPLPVQLGPEHEVACHALGDDS